MASRPFVSPNKWYILYTDPKSGANTFAPVAGPGSYRGPDGRMHAAIQGSSINKQVTPNPTNPDAGGVGGGLGGVTGIGGIGADLHTIGINAGGNPDILPGTQVDLGSAFNDLIGWLFHPLNWLRGVEFIAGFIIIILGLRFSFRSFSGPRVVPSPIRRIVRSPTRQGRRAGRRYEKYQQGYREGRREQRSSTST